MAKNSSVKDVIYRHLTVFRSKTEKKTLYERAIDEKTNSLNQRTAKQSKINNKTQKKLFSYKFPSVSLTRHSLQCNKHGNALSALN